MAEDRAGQTGVDAREYGRVVWRRKWLIGTVAALAALAGVVVSRDDRVTSYESSAEVLVKPITASPLDRPARVDGAVDLDTEAEILGSTAVAALAGAELGTTDSPAEVAERVTTSVVPDTQILELAYRAGSPSAAQAGAQAVAEAYLGYKAAEATDAVTSVTDRIESRIADLEEELSRANAALAANLPGTPASVEADNAREVASSQIALLRTEMSSYRAIDIDPGGVIRPASLGTPIRPRHLPIPLAAAMGLVVGCALAFVRDRSDDRLHRPGSVRQLLGVPLLATIPRRPRRRRHQPIAPADTPDAEAYQRLASGVLALQATEGTRTILVTSPAPGDGKTTVAANLAAALSRSRPVALVSADLRLPTLHEIFPVPGGHPTVTDLLEGGATAGEVRIVDPRWPRLAVYPSRPTTGLPTEQLRSQAMTDFLAELGRGDALVIVDAPPVLLFADALPLAARADATILVARQGKTTRTALTQAVGQLEQVGAHLAAGVVTRTSPGPARHGYSAYSSAADPGRYRRRREVLVAALGSALLVAGGAAATFDVPWPGGRSTASTTDPTVLGASATNPATTIPPTTAPPTTTPPPTVTSTTATTATTATTSTSTSTTTTSTTTTTTTTTVPPRIAAASATATAPGVTLRLDASPADDGRNRSVSLRLEAGFTDNRVLRSARIDFGDGRAADAAVEPWPCNAPGAPNPYVFTAPNHNYRAPGTYGITVLVTTATCSPDDDDWGPEESATVQLAVTAP